MTVRALTAPAALLLCAAFTIGCGARSADPAASVSVAKRVQDNPNLSPEQQQQMLRNIQSRQAAGRIRGRVMHQALQSH